MPIGQTADIRRILDELACLGVEPSHLAVVTPTLDDVFLSLTGQPAPLERTADRDLVGGKP